MILEVVFFDIGPKDFSVFCKAFKDWFHKIWIISKGSGGFSNWIRFGFSGWIQFGFSSWISFRVINNL